MNTNLQSTSFETDSLLVGITPILEGDCSGGPVGEASIDLQGVTETLVVRNLIGMAVSSHVEGVTLGQVHDVLFDLDANRVVALVLNDKNWLDLMDLKIVPWHETACIGRDSILVSSAESKMPLRNDEWSREAVRGCWECAFSSTEVRAATGETLGFLADTLVEESSGRVLGFKRNCDIRPETLRGKRFVPRPANGINAGGH